MDFCIVLVEAKRKRKTPSLTQGLRECVNRIAIEQSGAATNPAFLHSPARGSSPQEFLNYGSLVCQA